MFCDRFPHRYRNLSNSSGVKGKEESGKPDSRPLIPPTKDIMISLGEHSRHIKNVENSDTTKEFIARYGHGHPVSVEEDERKTRVDAIYDDEEAPRTTLEVTDGKQETSGKWGDVLMDTQGGHGEIMVGEDEETVSWAAEIHHQSLDWVGPLDILEYSSHRDGSIYRDTHEWKKEFRIVDRSESELSVSHFLLLFVIMAFFKL